MDEKHLISSHQSRVYDNFLMHWKYIKREKIIGAKKGEKQWKYFYKDDEKKDFNSKKEDEKSKKKSAAKDDKSKTKVKIGTTTESPKVAVKKNLVEKIKDKIEDVIGYDEKQAYVEAKNKADKKKSTSDTAKDAYDDAKFANNTANWIKGKKENALTTAKQRENTYDKMYKEAKTNADRFAIVPSLKDARKDREVAQEEYDRAIATESQTRVTMEEAKSKYETAYKEATDALFDEDNAKEAYEKTLLFKYGKFSENVDKLLSKLDDTLDEASDRFKDKMDGLRQKVDDMIETPKEKKEREAKEAAEAARAAEEAAKAAEDAANERGEEHLIDALEMKTGEWTKDEDQAIINPNYEEGMEWQYNCAYCTAAYDLRQRGYDVVAMPYDDATYDATLESIPTWYEDTTIDDWEMEIATDEYGWIDYSKVDEVHENTKETFEDMPDGSYGQFCVYWSTGGGHSMVWEKENGTTYIRDCQTNEKYTHDEWVSEYGDWSYGAFVLRTDNRVPSEKILDCVTNRETDSDDRDR